MSPANLMLLFFVGTIKLSEALNGTASTVASAPNAATTRTTTLTSISQIDCPELCVCSLLESGLIHAKCESTDGIKRAGKNLTIQSLDLSGIGLTRITGQLDKLKELTVLDLSHNRLSEPAKLSKRLRSLNLSHNRITSGKLWRLPQYLYSLNLSQNEITYLPNELRSLGQLRELELAGNPINCTCDTLHVRNWLQRRHVWSGNVVACTAPQRFKGKPWLQVRQTDVCDIEQPIAIAATSKYNWDDYQDNEMMQADMPASEGSGYDDMDDYLPANPGSAVRRISEPGIHLEEDESEEDIGSGNMEMDGTTVTPSREAIFGRLGRLNNAEHDETTDSAVKLEEEHHTEEEEDEDEDGSGSGSGFGIIPMVPVIGPDTLPDGAMEIIPDTTEADERPISEPPPFNPRLNGLGIFRPGDRVTDEPDTPHTIEPVVEEEIVPQVIRTDEAGVGPDMAIEPKLDNGQVSPSNVGVIDETAMEREDASSTYILLIILGVIFVALIIGVAMKNRKSQGRNRRPHDSEAPRETELLDMDKGLLGKPLSKNGGAPEKLPLMDPSEKVAKPINGERYAPYQNVPTPRKFEHEQEPPQRTRNGAPNDSQMKPPRQQSGVYDEMPQSPEANNNNRSRIPSAAANTNGGSPTMIVPPVVIDRPDSPKSDDEVFLPVMAANARYSPVYSPETGRVKIKLSETPKPKTPMLVTRSRSNGGEIVTTPNLNQRISPPHK